ncbi:tetratricopeptide repeat protein [Nonomuraea sp. NPDC003709]|uniref:tetratricopeptide repeat protein n=1 Tax=Nonomuraea sp. NPDC003709 TaxID=3154450 RepID=UPI0033BBFE7E
MGEAGVVSAEGGGIVRNELSGQVTGTVVQAADVGVINIAAPAMPAAPVRVPRQVPAEPPGFVNRTLELSLLDRHLADGPAVAVVCGLKGVGTSAVGRRWAHQARERFGDGQLYVDLGALRHGGATGVSDVLAAFLRALGVHESWIPEELPERAAMFRSMTAGSRLLVLVDGAEHAAEVTPLCPASPGSAVVVTSHRQLRGLLAEGAVPVTVGPLDTEQGLRLLTGMLGEERVDGQRTHAAELVRLCGGLPIALRMAGAQLMRHPAWSVERLIRDLAEAGRRLDRAATEGGVFVDAFFEAVYEGLPEGAARLYRLLGVLPGSAFSPGLAAAVLDDEPDQALDLLLDAHLVEEFAEDRYRMHDLVRLHAARRARSAEPPEARESALRRAAEWYLTGAAAADAAMGRRLRLADHGERAGWPFASRGEALDWLDAERADLLAVVRAAAAREWDEIVWQLAEALWPLHHDRGYHADCAEANALGVEAALRLEAPAVEARMRNQLARAQLMLGELDQARDQLVRARQAARASGDPRMEAVVLESLGRTALVQAEPDTAAESFAAASAIHERAGNGRGVGMQQYHLGLAHLDAGRHGEAAAALGRALPLMVAAGDALSQGRIHLELARAQRGLGRRAEAIRSARTAAEITRECRVPVKETQAWEFLAELAEDGGDREEAADCLRRALTVCLASGNLPRAETLRARLADVDRP